MHLATLILPTVNNDGVDQTDTLLAMQSVLCDTFGGFTCTIGEGGWKSDRGSFYRYPVAIYSIAMPDDSESRAKFDSIARFYGHMAGQICVMVTHANGKVVFHDLSTVGADRSLVNA